ncbi:Uu.00g017850.m01.CDS01 [Anthostomella pinea]|uniref:Uu.00g017850.m01.CDS01 n=1 Tax=Anthostomella pinea TaxID=933095 RepID=A0AAI8VZ14_9PEZI|nr:Uu.00g017850.m01.CDS01 [Anthostomella pinea]
MGIYTTLPQEIQEVDVIIAGGGTAGCIVASRLADADPELSVLIIESGRDNYNVPTVVHLVLWRGNHAPEEPRIYIHKAVKEEQLAGRESMVLVGNMLGGSSSMNLMMYTRAQRCDYDSWGVKGWSSDDLHPYLQKFQTYHGHGKSENHGHEGPIHVSGGPFRSTEAESDFIAAMQRVGYPEVENLQDFQSVGVAPIQKYVSPEGQRQDVAHTYLHPRLQDGKHANLHVLVESQVVRVTFDGDKRASGVEFRPNPAMQSTSVEDPVGAVKARKLVVISCGTLSTPSVLERSGVGSTEVLREAGVAAIAHLPGVGHDYQDHNMSMYAYKLGVGPELTFDAIQFGNTSIPELIAKKDQILGWNGIDASSKIRPTESEVDALGADFRKAWDRDFGKTPSKPLASMIFIAGLLADRAYGSQAAPGNTSLLASIRLIHTLAEHITGPDVNDPPCFRTGFLSDEHGLDLKAQVWAYKKQREIVRRMTLHRGGLTYRLPKFPPGSPASYDVEVADGVAPDVVEDLEYTPSDDAIIEDWIRRNMTTSWHGLGTCKMAPRDEMGVVDEALGVYGVSGLKIADLSIVPENVCANTMNTALMIGEKAADIFIRELGLAQ